MHGYTKNVHHAAEVTFPLETATNTKYIVDSNTIQSFNCRYSVLFMNTHNCIRFTSIIDLTDKMYTLRCKTSCTNDMRTCIRVYHDVLLWHMKNLLLCLWTGSDKSGLSMHMKQRQERIQCSKACRHQPKDILTTYILFL